MTPQIKKTYNIYIDTCVIQASGSKDKAKSEIVTLFLSELIKSNFSLVISEVTYFENLQGLKGAQAEKAVSILKKYEWKEITNEVLTVAALLGTFYSEKGRKDVDMGDKIIAASAFLDNGFILTENHKDFPNPFFILRRHYPLIYTKGHYKQTIDLGLYAPNNKYIKRLIEEK
jgi:hypothetical protein